MNSFATGLDEKERKALYQKEYRKKNAAALKEKKAEYYLRDKDKIKARLDANKETISAKYKEYYHSNRETMLEKGKRWREANKNWKTAWRKANKHKLCYYTAAYRASKQNATPSWITDTHLEEIDYFYQLSKECEILTGDKYHVDHIVPLNGKDVCGLHVPWNLQVLPAEINLSKSNKFNEGCNYECL